MCGCSEGSMTGGGGAKKKRVGDSKDTKAFWYAKAKALDITGRSKMNKDQLKRAIKKATK